MNRFLLVLLSVGLLGGIVPAIADGDNISAKSLSEQRLEGLKAYKAEQDALRKKRDDARRAKAAEIIMAKGKAN